MCNFLQKIAVRATNIGNDKVNREKRIMKNKIRNKVERKDMKEKVEYIVSIVNSK